MKRAAIVIKAPKKIQAKTKTLIRRIAASALTIFIADRIGFRNAMAADRSY